MKRSWRYRAVVALERTHNRVARWQLQHGRGPKAYALLETTGRRTGLPRRTPVGDGLVGDTFWLIAVHGGQADYVRNLLAQPRVRVKVGGWWRVGHAVVLPDDDARARSYELPHQWDKAIGRLVGTAPLTVRIDLEP